MKDFAKSIVCNTKVGNGITKFGMGTYVIADGHKAVVLGETVERGPNGIPFGWVTIRWVEGPWKGQNDQQYDYDLKKAGNTKTGNAGGNLDAAAARDIREMAAKYWHSGIHDTRQLATTVAWEWAKKSKTVRDTTQDLVSEVKDIIDRSLNEIKTGNKKVGNADVYSGNYIIMGDDGDVWFRDEHEDVSIKQIDAWAQKRISEYQRSIDEIKKGVAEAKQQAKKYGLL